MEATIDLRLFATLQQFSPDNSKAFTITPGTTVREVLETINVPVEKAKLIFVNGLKKDLDVELVGGERVGIFPPVGGG
jgi:molybdopterin synthase sulfur carrier subunit